MNKSSASLKLLTLALLAIPFSSFADSWSCRHGDDVREIHVTQSAASPTPCSVVYKKLTEGFEDQVLWTAQNDASYCEEKAKAFVEKQIGWGWTCVETVSDDDTVEASTTEETKQAGDAFTNADSESMPTE